ncbi:hypothetical protein [Azospirillum halopraeferens]|uniref:hypothetical protein n=1 Tax=Azospirillum halopraeferens TaxID=34010 RepID=UPI0004285134|nr:hypothetical protein [Azospirillum halopraeferens]
MSRSNDFAQAFAAAHADLGLARVSVTHILQRIAEDPAFLFGEELRSFGGQCPVHAGTNPEDRDKVAVNTLLAFLFHGLKTFMETHLPADGAGSIPLVPPPRSPYREALADPAARAAAPPEVLVSYLRDSTCHLLDEVITRWAAEVLAEEERCRQQGGGSITTVAAASFVLRTILEGSELYQRAGYDMLSITKTGSHTAIHICWSLVEAAPLLVPGRDAAFYDDLVRRSLKQVVPLSVSSLGMLVHYMEASGMEPPDGLAIHLLPKDQTAFALDDAGLIRLRAAPITPFRKPDEQHYTGCPAFYVPGLIKLYMDTVASIARDHGVYARLAER